MSREMYDIPQNKINQDSINKLFVIVQDGNYDKIKKFTSESNMDFNVVEKFTGETVIHKILNNPRSGMDEEQKRYLVKFFLEHGVSVDAHNKNNVRALHLACKYQMKTVVRLLLDYNANPSSPDASGMTPMHYASQGNIVECPKRRMTRSLIPDTAVKKAPVEGVDNLAKKIIDLLKNAGGIPEFLKHIKNSVRNFEKIHDLPKQDYVLYGGLKTEKEIRRDRFRQQVTSSNLLISFIEERLKNTLSVMGGYGEQNFVKKNVFIEKLADSSRRLKKEIFDQLEVGMADIDKKMGELGAFSDSLNRFLTVDIQNIPNFSFAIVGTDATFTNSGTVIHSFEEAILKWAIDLHDENEQEINIYNGKVPSSSKHEFNYIILYAVSKMRILVGQLNDGIKNAESASEKELATKVIPSIIIKIINIAQYLRYISIDKKNALDKRIEKILDELATLEGKAQSSGIPPNDLKGLESVIKTGLTAINDLKKMYKDLTKMFGILSGIHKQVNRLYTYLTSESVHQFESIFFGDANDFTLDASQKRIENLFTHPFEPVGELPETLDSYVAKYLFFDQNEINVLKRRLYEEYVPRVDQNRYSVYIDSSASENPIIGYLVDEIYQLVINKSGLAKDDYPFMENQGCEMDVMNDFSLIQSASCGNFGNKIVGRLGNLQSAAQDVATITIYPSMSDNLDSHFNYIKSLIIKNVIEMSKTNPEITRELESIITNLKISANMDSFRENTIGKITDGLLIAFIKVAIQKYATRSERDLDWADVKNTVDPGMGVTSGFKLHYNRLIESVLRPYIDGETNSMQPLRYSSIIMEDDEQPESGSYTPVYNQDYHNPNEITEKDCYKIETEIVKYLRTAGGAINEYDYFGNTPIFYAIKILHVNLIKTLISCGAAVHSSTIKNSQGKNPLEYARQMYADHRINDHRGVSKIVKIFCDPILKGITDNLSSKNDYKGNIPRYLSNVFPQLLLMYNHLFRFYMDRFINDWTLDDFKNLGKMFKTHLDVEIDGDKMPMIRLIKNHLVIQKDSSRHVLMQKKKELGDELSRFERLNERIVKIDEIMAEMKNDPDYGKMADLEAKAQKVKNDLVKKRDAIDVAKIRKEIDFINEKIRIDDPTKYGEKKIIYFANQRFTEIDGYYDGLIRIFMRGDRIENANIRLYNEMWAEYIKNDSALKNGLNIHLLLVLLQKFTSDEPIPKLYREIFKYLILSYDELPKDYEQNNFMLNDVTKIMIHVVRYNLANNLYDAVVKTVTKYVSTQDEKQVASTVTNVIGSVLKPGTVYPSKQPPQPNSIQNQIDAAINEIALIGKSVEDSTDVEAINAALNKARKIKSELFSKSDVQPYIGYDDFKKGRADLDEEISKILSRLKGGDPDLHRYIVGKMPKYLVKTQLKLFKNDYDPDKELTIDEIFSRISEIIMANKTLKIEKDSPLIENLERYLFPLYKDVFQQTIPKMRVVIDNYNRYILNESKYIDVLNRLASAEK